MRIITIFIILRYFYDIAVVDGESVSPDENSFNLGENLLINDFNHWLQEHGIDQKKVDRRY